MLDNYSLLKKLERNIVEKFDEVKNENFWNALRLLSPIAIMFSLREIDDNILKNIFVAIFFITLLLTFKVVREIFSFRKKMTWAKRSSRIELEGFIARNPKNITELTLWINILQKENNHDSLDLFIFVIKDEFENICSECKDAENAIETAKSLKDPLEPELILLSKDYYTAQTQAAKKVVEILEKNREKFTATRIFEELKTNTSTF